MRDEAREREQRLTETNKQLAEADRSRADFLRTMSDELRSPMNDVLGYAHLLLDGLDGELTPQQAADVGQIASSADRLLGLINNVIDFSRLDAGWEGNPATDVDVAPIIIQARNQFALEAAEKGIEVLVDVPAGLPAALADPTAVAQALSNVVGNAVKFTQVGRVSVMARATPAGITIAVADTGVGIPEEGLARVFEPFRQVDAGTTRSHSGAGLGLAIARKLIELQHGTITAESRVGVGSIFTITLPLAHPELLAPPVAAEPLPSEPAAAGRPGVAAGPERALSIPPSPGQRGGGAARPKPPGSPSPQVTPGGFGAPAARPAALRRAGSKGDGRPATARPGFLSKPGGPVRNGSAGANAATAPKRLPSPAGGGGPGRPKP